MLLLLLMVDVGFGFRPKLNGGVLEEKGIDSQANLGREGQKSDASRCHHKLCFEDLLRSFVLANVRKHEV